MRERLPLESAGGTELSADSLKREENALRLLCAFNGVKDYKNAPPEWWFYPNKNVKSAWLRVEEEAQRTWSGK